MSLGKEPASLPNDALTEADDFASAGDLWKLNTDRTFAFQWKAGPRGMTIGVKVDAIQSRGRNSQSATTPYNVQSRPGLAGEHLAAILDEVGVAIEDISFRHGVSLP